MVKTDRREMKQGKRSKRPVEMECFHLTNYTVNRGIISTKAELIVEEKHDMVSLLLFSLSHLNEAFLLTII